MLWVRFPLWTWVIFSVPTFICNWSRTKQTSRRFGFLLEDKGAQNAKLVACLLLLSRLIKRYIFIAAASCLVPALLQRTHSRLPVCTADQRSVRPRTSSSLLFQPERNPVCLKSALSIAPWIHVYFNAQMLIILERIDYTLRTFDVNLTFEAPTGSSQ